jgi:hypothetical protein
MSYECRTVLPTTLKYTPLRVHIFLDFQHKTVPGFLNLENFLLMFNDIVIKYFNPGLGVGMQDIRNAWLLGAEPVRLIASLHRGNLVFRVPGSRKRISYKLLKKD